MDIVILQVCRQPLPEYPWIFVWNIVRISPLKFFFSFFNLDKYMKGYFNIWIFISALYLCGHVSRLVLNFYLRARYFIPISDNIQISANSMVQTILHHDKWEHLKIVLIENNEHNILILFYLCNFISEIGVSNWYVAGHVLAWYSLKQSVIIWRRLFEQFNNVYDQFSNQISVGLPGIFSNFSHRSNAKFAPSVKERRAVFDCPKDQ